MPSGRFQLKTGLLFARKRRFCTSIFSRGIVGRGFLFSLLGLALFFATFICGLGPERLQDHRPEAGIDLFQIGHELVLGCRVDGPDLLKFAHHLLEGLGIGLAAGRLGRRRRGCFRVAGRRTLVRATPPRPGWGCAAGQQRQAKSHSGPGSANSSPVLEAAIAHPTHPPRRKYPYNWGRIVVEGPRTCKGENLASSPAPLKKSRATAPRERPGHPPAASPRGLQ